MKGTSGGQAFALNQASDKVPESWARSLPKLVSALHGENDGAAEAAYAELRRMAAAADLWNAHVHERERAGGTR